MIRKFPLKFPIPGPLAPLAGPLVTLIIKGAKTLWDKFANSKSSEEMAGKDKFNEENIADIIDYNKLLNEVTKEIENDIYEIEQKIMAECTEYYEELIFLIEAVEESKNINLHSKYIKRNIEKLKKDSKGSLMKSINREMSLDNSQLKKILALPAGELKKNRIQAFKENLIQEALNDFTSEVRTSIEDFSDDISGELNQVISDIKRNSEILSEELTALENSINNDKQSIEILINNAEEKNLICDEILNVIEE